MCEKPNPAAYTDCPAGYHIRPIRRDDMNFWYSVHFDCEMGDISDHIAYMKDYFRRVYAPREDEFFRRCLVICGEDDVIILNNRSANLIYEGNEVIVSVGILRQILGQVLSCQGQNYSQQK